MNPRDADPSQFARSNRRSILKASTGVLALGSLTAEARADTQKASESPERRGRINQSIVHWCFEKYWDVPKMIEVAKQLGCKSIELVDSKYFPLLKQAGLECAIGQIDMQPDPPFAKGFNNPKYQDRVIKATKDAIDACAAHGFKKVICFTGFAEDISAVQGAKNCVEGFKKVLPYAEDKGVTLCLEMLNSRDATDMKGHPGYQGDHTDYCVDIIKRVGSPNLKLLFDIYHVQIMDGDIIRRIRQHKDVIGHVHTAGNPGRGELDDKQEIAYKPIMEALIEIGYQGFVGQEFIPTRDPLAGLRQAVTLCDV
ncbi:hydroxypyruvate isomerase family protein [Tundrisphaera lichenicola]|uniref:hydroxypyruvate isomerase family protein n=1 Tax=Tundrisphaera lichenicola TaxID=2029860 RepID=UPI003EB6FD32